MEAVFRLLERLIDIPSVTGEESRCAEFLADWLRVRGFAVQLQPVTPGRANVFASMGRPEIVLSTHIDTVGPHLPYSEDAEWIWGRGACDAKGCMASQMIAAERLLAEGCRDFGLLFVVGEETESDGGRAANQTPCGSRYLVAGEPTENRLVVATKGVLQLRLRTRGRAAHSAYPELGESAIEKLLDLLERLRTMPLPSDPELGATTMNIGRIFGGTAANVIPAEAETTILYRTVDEGNELAEQIRAVVDGHAEYEFSRQVAPARLERMENFDRSVVAFTTDVPNLSRWGRPLLIGPGSILDAHTMNERVSKEQLVRAVALYAQLVRDLKSRSESDEKRA